MNTKPLSEQIAGWCKHYRPPVHSDTCEAGVSYEAVADVEARGRFGYLRRLPCLASNHQAAAGRGETLCACPHMVFPTEEEAAAEATETRALVDRMVRQVSKVRPSIMRDVKSRGLLKQTTKGEIPCPICDGGTVHYTYAGSVNGHVWARCTTEDCVNWTE